MSRLFAVAVISAALTGVTLFAGQSSVAQMRPGEPPKGDLSGPDECVYIKVSKSECPSGRMKVCGASSLQGKRTRSCA